MNLNWVPEIVHSKFIKCTIQCKHVTCHLSWPRMRSSAKIWNNAHLIVMNYEMISQWYKDKCKIVLMYSVNACTFIVYWPPSCTGSQVQHFLVLVFVISEELMQIIDDYSKWSRTSIILLSLTWSCPYYLLVVSYVAFAFKSFWKTATFHPYGNFKNKSIMHYDIMTWLCCL